MKTLPEDSFLHNCERLGAPGGRKRWRSTCGERLYEWDSRHGEVEVYDPRGRHMEVVGPYGDRIKGAVKGRKIDV